MNVPCGVAAREDQVDAIVRFVQRHHRVFVLTGAGCSTDSGIPDYRDSAGNWKHRQPVRLQAFVRSQNTRQRYWARSLLGWQRIAGARPNAAHRALARLESAGYIHQLVTQNVDGLHQHAGSRRVIDLHGRLDTVECLDCGYRQSRSRLQRTLEALNPDFGDYPLVAAPDGDAQLEDAAVARFRIPECPHCGGVLKPAVVFFGESVPRGRVDASYARLAEAEGLLVVGTSLMVYSGYRFCRAATEMNKPVAAVNLGRTRADSELELKVEASCGDVLSQVACRLCG